MSGQKMELTDLQFWIYKWLTSQFNYRELLKTLMEKYPSGNMTGATIGGIQVLDISKLVYNNNKNLDLLKCTSIQFSGLRTAQTQGANEAVQRNQKRLC